MQVRRILSVWLPWLATERLGPQEAPLAVTESGGRRSVLAVNRAAKRLGLRPGMPTADAQAIFPALRLAPADPAAECSLLEELTQWANRYTPWAAVDSSSRLCPGGGLWLDITGAAHLWGGERELLADLRERLARRGLTARLAIADYPGAAWGWARFGAGGVLESGAEQGALATLSVRGLRLPAEMVTGLVRLGLCRIGDLMALPTAALTARFGRLVGQRLDQALGRVDEPISPVRPSEEYRSQRSFAEPIGRSEDIALACRQLLETLCQQLRRQGRGLRRLQFVLYRVDSTCQEVTIGTSRPSRDVGHLFRLLTEPLGRLNAGFGIETLALIAGETAAWAEQQGEFSGRHQEGGDRLALLLDSLGNRLGFASLSRIRPAQSHLPERAFHRLPVSASPRPEPWPSFRRPICLLSRPECIDVMAPLPDAPPLLFHWRRQRHHVHRAEGPERIALEWWQEPEENAAGTRDRDYYCVEDRIGRRFWIYREGRYETPAPDGSPPVRWYLHGIFA